MSLSNEVRKGIRELTEQIRQDDTYLQYRETRQILEEDRKLTEQTDAYRKEYFELLGSGNEDGNLYYRQKDFREAHGELLDHREVRRFLKAEAAYARLIREVMTEVMEGLEEQ